MTDFRLVEWAMRLPMHVQGTQRRYEVFAEEGVEQVSSRPIACIVPKWDLRFHSPNGCAARCALVGEELVHDDTLMSAFRFAKRGEFANCCGNRWKAIASRILCYGAF